MKKKGDKEEKDGDRESRRKGSPSKRGRERERAKTKEVKNREERSVAMGQIAESVLDVN